ncbi:MAG TPA: hypothetical protein VKJ65_08860 [Phycisphaerae bacterium]|nr:hypothetical protein [Phycisphaerae bacterium]
MKAPTIILGDLSSIMRLRKAPLRNSSDWTQWDSDILAHLIQVTTQIQQSRWFKSKISLTSQGNHELPEFEDFVFAAVYLRQLIAKNDRLLEDAVTRYCRVIDCMIRPAWVQYELNSFNRLLASDPFNLTGCTLHELFDAFMYGAALMHKIPPEGDIKRERFLEIYDKQPRANLIFALNMQLKLLMNHVTKITNVIYRDYSNWLVDYNLPRPDTRWHDKLFKIKQQL